MDTIDTADSATVRFIRRVLLLASTWVTAYIYKLLCEIADAARIHGDVHGTSPDASPSAGLRQHQRAETPTLQAGASCPRAASGTAGEHTVGACTWLPLDAKDFQVRCGPDYPRKKLKAPSASALGEVVAVDVLRTDHKIFNLLALNHIALPPATPGWDETYPEFFVINQMLPVRFNKALFPGAGNDDGETFNLIVYVRLPPKLGLGWSADKEPCGAEELLKRCVWP